MVAIIVNTAARTKDFLQSNNLKLSKSKYYTQKGQVRSSLASWLDNLTENNGKYFRKIGLSLWN
jgi:hypothetical protein